MNVTKPQTGTAATDSYREGKGLAAAQVLSVGRSVLCTSTDHLNGSELCTEVIVRKSNDVTKMGSDANKLNTIHKAIDVLKIGNGYHVNLANHSGGNTCAAVIAAATQ